MAVKFNLGGSFVFWGLILAINVDPKTSPQVTGLSVVDLGK